MIAQPQPLPANSSSDVRLVTEIRGVPTRLFDQQYGDVVISGPAGTGKTRAILEWIHRRCSTERIRVLLLRKTLESLKGSALLTYQQQVLYRFDGKRSLLDGVEYFGGNSIRPADFTYTETGSKIVLGGMDNISKVLSTEYDVIYINEVTELKLDEWENLTNRTDRPTLENDRPASIVIGDCNPGPPTHWIKQKEADKQLVLWSSRHEDNPAMWDRTTKQWTVSGERYLRRLDRNTGVRYKRFRLGLWVTAEGQIYDGWNPDIHLIDRFDIPAEWPRYWCLDFGYVNPFVWNWYAVDPDGRLYLYRQIYMRRRLVEDHAALGMRLSLNEPKPRDVIADHDAEDRATFERKTGYSTSAAKKSVSPGIQAVAARLRVEGDGKPRLFILRDSLHERDKELAESGKPSSTEEEFATYVWDMRENRKVGESPVKEDDHGMDNIRYAISNLDLRTYMRIS